MSVKARLSSDDCFFVGAVMVLLSCAVEAVRVVAGGVIGDGRTAGGVGHVGDFLPDGEVGGAFNCERVARFAGDDECHATIWQRCDALHPERRERQDGEAGVGTGDDPGDVRDEDGIISSMGELCVAADEGGRGRAKNVSVVEPPLIRG